MNKPLSIGEEMYALASRLYPICRSITGDGVRETFGILREHIPVEVREVATGTQVFDWTVPKEWNIRDAWIKNEAGEKIVDFKQCNLHVLSYSVPVRAKLSLDELKRHIFTLPSFPDRIPYRTSYYKENWAFCLSENQLSRMREGEYEVCIDSSLEDGHLTYGELYIKGASSDEMLISCHTCHPSLANDNLSGVVLATYVARRILEQKRRYSYRFLFIPGTIGSIVWLAHNEEKLGNIKHGLVFAGVGDSGKFHYKKSRRGNAEIDHAAIHVLKHAGEFGVEEFTPYGYDERQFCSPAFNLPVGCLMRTPHGRYTEYHTSADNLHFVRAEYLEESYRQCVSIFDVLESNRRFRNLNPKCEPQLGRRGLYQMIGGGEEGKRKELGLLWVLNLSDGAHSLLDIAERSGLAFAVIKDAADALLSHGLLEMCEPLGGTL
jgi:aminopeptidase-like protein